MTFFQKFRRILSSITKTSSYSGRFLFFALRIGFIKTVILYIMVRKYKISLILYSKIAKEMEIVNSVSLGLCLYKGRFSYNEIKFAVRSLDNKAEFEIRREFENEFLKKFDN